MNRIRIHSKKTNRQDMSDKLYNLGKKEAEEKAQFIHKEGYDLGWNEGYACREERINELKIEHQEEIKNHINDYKETEDIMYRYRAKLKKCSAAYVKMEAKCEVLEDLLKER